MSLLHDSERLRADLFVSRSTAAAASAAAHAAMKRSKRKVELTVFDVDENRRLAEELNIVGVPTLLLRYPSGIECRRVGTFTSEDASAWFRHPKQ